MNVTRDGSHAKYMKPKDTVRFSSPCSLVRSISVPIVVHFSTHCSPFQYFFVFVLVRVCLFLVVSINHDTQYNRVPQALENMENS